MKKPLLILALVFSIGQMLAQEGFGWQKVASSTTSKLARIQQNSNNEDEQYFSVNLNAIRQVLISAKDKFSNEPGVQIEFPNLNGELERFNVWENSNLEPSFQAQFPEIRAYVGKSIVDGATINFSVSPLGIQTVLFRPEGGTEFIEAYDKQATTYVLYGDKNRNKADSFKCSTIEGHLGIDSSENTNINGKASNKKYKTFRLALSCTAEYSNYFGATSSANVSLVIAAMNATMTRVNGVYERDLALHFNMINNTSIIYYDVASDPYSDAATGSNGAWNDELMFNLNSTIGDSAFDLGHLFGGDGGGGNAGCIGCVCSNVLATGISSNSNVSNYKGGGYTSPSPGSNGISVPAGDTFDIDYVAHEIGHQLGANHTFTHGFEGSQAQVEPGSGSTIMGYAGITSYNVQSNSDPIFAYKSILQIQTNLNLASKSCAVTTTMTNNTPVVNAGVNYTIPIGTAFMLTGTATDADASDVLTYLWEQNDVGTDQTLTSGANSRVVSTKSIGPTFRTFKPSSKLSRYFPQMGKILAGTISIATGSNANWETVSTVARNLNFVFIARDNAAGAGQTGSDATQIAVNATGGAFSVSSQSTTGISYSGNSTQTVTWVPGSTASAPFNSPTVDILISTNASNALELFNPSSPTSPNPTTWTTIASGVPNNGSYVVTLPNVPTTRTTCRFMVKAVGNVFLAVNSKNFTITPDLANEQFGLDNFSIFPNPNNGNFTIKFDSSSSNEIVVGVYDMRGRDVFVKSYQNNGFFNEILNLKGLESGVYLVSVKDGDKKEVKRIIIE